MIYLRDITVNLTIPGQHGYETTCSGGPNSWEECLAKAGVLCKSRGPMLYWKIMGSGFRSHSTRLSVRADMKLITMSRSQSCAMCQWSQAALVDAGDLSRLLQIWILDRTLARKIYARQFSSKVSGRPPLVLDIASHWTAEREQPSEREDRYQGSADLA